MSSFGGAVEQARRAAEVQEMRNRFRDDTVIDAPWGTFNPSPISAPSIILPDTVSGELLRVKSVTVDKVDPALRGRMWVDDFSVVNDATWPTLYSGATTKLGEWSVEESGAAHFGGTLFKTKGYVVAYGPVMPYDPLVLYRLRIRFRRTVAGTNSEPIYAGMRGVAADGETIVGSNNVYAAACGYIPATTDWYVLTGYVYGYGATDIEYGGTCAGGQVAYRTPGRPSKMHPDAQYWKPIMLINYNTDDGGEWEIDYFMVEPVMDLDSVPTINISANNTIISSSPAGALPDNGLYMAADQLRIRVGGADKVKLDASTGVSITCTTGTVPGVTERLSFQKSDGTETMWMGSSYDGSYTYIRSLIAGDMDIDNTGGHLLLRADDVTIWGSHHIAAVGAGEEFTFSTPRTMSGGATAIVGVPIINGDNHTFVPGNFSSGLASTTLSWGPRADPPDVVIANPIGTYPCIAYIAGGSASGATLYCKTISGSAPGGNIVVRWMAVWLAAEGSIA